MSASSTLPERCDVLVVGARCAGAATARLLAQRGFRVLVVDRGAFGQDTLSTHALLRPAVLQLHRWGLLDQVRAAGTPAIRRTAFHYGPDTVEVLLRDRDGVDALYAPRRTVLDPILVRAAERAGAEVRYGMRVVDLLRSRTGRVIGAMVKDTAGAMHTVRAELVIGADGVRSNVAAMVGAEVRATGRHAVSFVYGYFSGVPNHGYRWFYRPGSSAGAIPTNDDLTCVFVGVPREVFEADRRAGLDAAYHRHLAALAPDLAPSLAAAPRLGHLRRFPGAPGFLRQATGPGWALVGDAGYFRDPITAHGITDALRDAELLARAVVAGRDQALREYEAQRDLLSRRFLEVSDEIASFAWSLDQVRVLHQATTEEMKREYAEIRALPAAAAAAEPGRSRPTAAGPALPGAGAAAAGDVI